LDPLLVNASGRHCAVSNLITSHRIR
jgi:hypothetical protein